MGIDFAMAEKVLKDIWLKSRVAMLGWNDSRTFAVLKKSTGGGKQILIPVRLAGPPAVGAYFPDVLSMMDGEGTQYEQFQVPWMDAYGIAAVEGKAYAAAEKEGTGAFIDVMAAEQAGIEEQVVRRANLHLHTDGTGKIADIAAGSTVNTTALTLANRWDAFRFRKGMHVRATADFASTPRTGYAVIAGVNRKDGILTATAAWDTTITGLLNTDDLFLRGDYNAANDRLPIYGFESWNPTTTPGGADDFCNVNRSQDAELLAGVRYDASTTGEALDEAIQSGVAEGVANGMFRKASRPLCIMHPARYAQWARLVEGKTTTVRLAAQGFEGQQVAGVGFDALMVKTLTGQNVAVLDDIDADYNKIRVVDLDSYEFRSMKPFPAILNINGQVFIQTYNKDGFNCRVGGYANGVGVDPAQLINIKVA
jgi:hypothetical protein